MTLEIEATVERCAFAVLFQMRRDTGGDMVWEKEPEAIRAACRRIARAVLIAAAIGPTSPPQDPQP